jgi:ABC-2 type transport system ATP-binding protein
VPNLTTAPIGVKIFACIRQPVIEPFQRRSAGVSVIQVRNLTKYYGKARGIVDVSFDVEEGEVFGFIGPNGAGKSTTIRLFCSLIYPTSGTATIFGKDCFKHGPEIRQEIGYLPSEVFYYERMKVLDLLRYSASFYDRDCTQRLHELAEIMELDLKRRIDDLSYGNKKKVGIVQGLLHQPKLIVLDEPTAGLDPLMQRNFFELVREENRTRGATVFFSSHILGEVQRLCSRVAIIREGHVVEIQDIETLQRDNYKKVRVAAEGIDAARFDLEGVTNLETGVNSVRFFYRGDINPIMKVIGQTEVIDVTIEEPTLEEIFMHYYE